LPAHAWKPPGEADAGLRLEHRPGEDLDEAWVRRQFQLNGLPDARGVSRALALVQLINRAYLGAGYLNSGLVVRPSTAPGVLELRLVFGGLAPPAEGKAEIAVAFPGNRAKGLNAGFIRDRMPSAARRPLNARDLERDFRLLAEDPAIRTVNADLRPGRRPGEASLAVIVYPQDRADFYVTAANNRSPSVGGERAALGGFMRNLLAAGDLVSVEGGLTEGVEDVAASYAIPFLSPRTTLSVRGALDNAAVIDSELNPLDIKARDRSAEASLTHKFIDRPLLPAARAGRWSPAQTLTLGVVASWRRSTSYLLGERFSFAPGSVNGRSEYKAVRLYGDYVVRNVDQVFALSVTATQGIDGSRTDLPGLPVPQEDFRAVLAQANYARRLSAKGLELRARLYGQWSDSVLYSGERLAAGGETTVRGYRETLLLADKGVIGSVELAQPFNLSDRRGAARAFDWGAFTLSGFADGAYVKNHSDPQPEHEIYSVGASLAWTPAEALSARITYAQDLREVAAAGKRDLQDRGVQFRVTIHPLKIPAALR
jgi:hemolysin activation/secretion protein